MELGSLTGTVKIFVDLIYGTISSSKCKNNHNTKQLYVEQTNNLIIIQLQWETIGSITNSNCFNGDVFFYSWLAGWRFLTQAWKRYICAFHQLISTSNCLGLEHSHRLWHWHLTFDIHVWKYGLTRRGKRKPCSGTNIWTKQRNSVEPKGFFVQRNLFA